MLFLAYCEGKIEYFSYIRKFFKQNYYCAPVDRLLSWRGNVLSGYILVDGIIGEELDYYNLAKLRNNIEPRNHNLKPIRRAMLER